MTFDQIKWFAEEIRNQSPTLRAAIVACGLSECIGYIRPTMCREYPPSDKTDEEAVRRFTGLLREIADMYEANYIEKYNKK